MSTVTTIVDLLPPEIFEPPPLSPQLLTPQESIDSLINDVPNTVVPANAREAARNNIIREMVETERKYVQDLEVMQVCRLMCSWIFVLLWVEIRECAVPQQHDRSRHHSSTLPWPEQSIKLPKKVPNSPRRHCRIAMERSALGSPFSGTRKHWLLFIYLFALTQCTLDHSRRTLSQRRRMILRCMNHTVQTTQVQWNLC